MKKSCFLSTQSGQATTEMVLLFPVLIVFVLFIIKIFGLLVLNQKMQIAGTYAARRYQLQSHVTDFYEQGWDRRFLKKDIQRKVEDFLGVNKKSPTAHHPPPLSPFRVTSAPTALPQGGAVVR